MTKKHTHERKNSIEVHITVNPYEGAPASTKRNIGPNVGIGSKSTDALIRTQNSDDLIGSIMDSPIRDQKLFPAVMEEDE